MTMTDIPFDDFDSLADEQQELIRFVADKKIVGIRFGSPEGFDLLFDDGSELELYATTPVSDGATISSDEILAWAMLTPEEAAEYEAESLAMGDDSAMEDADYQEWLAEQYRDAERASYDAPSCEG